jgi:hypothetical protein
MQTNTHRETSANDTSTDQLQHFLRAELSAVETYELALKSITHVGLHRTLQEILTSHSRRVDSLRARIGRQGTDPETSSGVWGAFAKAFQAGADLLGDRTAISALEQDEDRGLALYTEGLASHDLRTQKFIEAELLPAQEHTHDLCRTLKTYMKATS